LSIQTGRYRGGWDGERPQEAPDRLVRRMVWAG
jgi:hypothetical protein